jgi:arylformamidase
MTLEPTLWRGLTRAELDQAYRPSSMVPSITPFLERYRDDSAAVRSAFPAARWATHAYGAGAEHSLDLFLPAAEVGPAPLFAFIHGGFWRALHRSDLSFPARAMTAAGLAYAALNYTLAPHATLEVIVEEMRMAVAWLWRERTRLGLDAGGLVLGGHSAGAHLTAMVLATDWAARGVEPAPTFRGAILVGGVFDLAPIRLCYVNEPLGLDAERAHALSPLHLRPTADCPLLITWGEHETAEFKRQSRDFADVWGAPTRPVTLFEQAGRNHFDALFDWCDPAMRLHRETMALAR